MAHVSQLYLVLAALMYPTVGKLDHHFCAKELAVCPSLMLAAARLCSVAA
jgi:hypothetical protein